ncbi:MAG: carboxynorspermidine decarboxylase [Sphaerochaeta sp.]
MIDSKKIEHTPAFVLEYGKFIKNLELIQELQDSLPVSFLFALKGFAMHAVFPELASVASGATASSLHEALLASPFFNEVHAYAPVYQKNEFETIASMATHITFNSISQLETYRYRSSNANLGLRINAMYSTVSTALYDPCSYGSRLGILPKDLPQLPDGVSGLHSHNLCESGAQELAHTLSSIEKHWGHLLGKIEWLNLGGGHLVTRKGYDLDLFKKTIMDFHDRYPHISLILEPGAAFVWETGYLVTEILDIVENGGIKTLMLDTSFAAHMPDCLEMPYSPKVLGSRLVESGSYRLGGSSCLAGDWVGSYEFESEPKIGDRLILEDMMHYTMVKTTMFNGLALPDIGIYRDGSYHVVKSFGFDDYQRRLS